MSSEPRLTYGEMELNATPFKAGYTMMFSREMGLDMGLVQPTPEEAAEREASLAEFRETCRRAWDGYAETIYDLGQLTDPGIRAVLDLHAPDETGYEVRCAHCCYDTEMGDMAEWPCETVTVVAQARQIALPPMTLYTEYRS